MKQETLIREDEKSPSFMRGRCHDERKAEESTPSTQAFNLREINENMTILLGVASSQGEDVRTVKNNLSILRENMEQRFNGTDRRLESMEQRFSSMEQGFTSLEGKFEQVLQILTTPPRQTNDLFDIQRKTPGFYVR